MTKNKALTHLLNKEAFLNASKLRTKEVEIPDVGTVLIRELNTAQRKEYLDYLELDKDNKPQFSIDKQLAFNKFVVSMSVINEDKTKMFESLNDVPDLRQDAMDIIVKAILDLSGIITADVKAPLAETQKNISDMPSQ